MSYLDTRDLIEERDQLLAEREEDPEVFDDEIDADRLNALEDLIDELAQHSGEDPEYGITLIPEDEFEDYARQLAEDVGAIGDDVSWPATHIDWEAAAEDLAQDYTTVEFDGKTYYYR